MFFYIYSFNFTCFSEFNRKYKQILIYSFLIVKVVFQNFTYSLLIVEVVFRHNNNRDRYCHRIQPDWCRVTVSNLLFGFWVVSSSSRGSTTFLPVVETDLRKCVSLLKILRLKGFFYVCNFHPVSVFLRKLVSTPFKSLFENGFCFD